MKTTTAKLGFLLLALGACQANVPLGDGNGAVKAAPSDAGDGNVPADAAAEPDPISARPDAAVEPTDASPGPLAGGERVTYTGQCTKQITCSTLVDATRDTQTIVHTDPPAPFSTTLDRYDHILDADEMAAYPWQETPSGAIPVVPQLDATNAYTFISAKPSGFPVGTAGVNGVVYSRPGAPSAAAPADFDAALNYVTSDTTFESNYRVTRYEPSGDCAGSGSAFVHEYWECRATR